MTSYNVNVSDDVYKYANASHKCEVSCISVDNESNCLYVLPVNEVACPKYNSIDEAVKYVYNSTNHTGYAVKS